MSGRQAALPPNGVDVNRPSEERLRECRRLIFQWMKDDGTWDRVMQRVREQRAAQASD